MGSQQSVPLIDVSRGLKAVAFAGAAGLAGGWFFNSPLLIQNIGPYSDVHFDTVLCLMLLSLASLLPRRWYKFPCLLAGMAAVTALLTILGYTMRFTQPMDWLLEQAGIISARRSATLHMPFTTALAVLLVCLALVILRLPTQRMLNNTFALAAAVVGGVVMVQDLLTQQFFIRVPDFSGTHDVSLQSSVVIIILCAALAICAGRRLQTVPYRGLDHYYAWSTLALATTFLIAWEYQERIDWTQRAFETEVALKRVGEEISQQIHRIGQAQIQLANRWPMSGTQGQDPWQRDAAAVLAESRGLLSIAFVDLNHIPLWRVGRRDARIDGLGLDLDKDPMARLTFDAADRGAVMQMSPTIHLAGGQEVRLFVTPLFKGATAAGYLLATLKLADFPGLVPEDVAQDFNVDIRNYAPNAHGVLVSVTDLGTRVRKSAHIAVFGQYWTINAWPKESYILAHRSPLLRPTLIFGTLMTFLLGTAFARTRQSQISLRRESQAKSRLAITLDRIGEGFLTLSRDWQITYANAQAAQITGHSKTDLIGKSALDISANLDGITHAPALAFAMEGKGPGHFVGDLKQGRALDATAYPVDDGVAVIFRDVTRERARDEHLRLLESAVARQNDVVIITDAEIADGPGSQRIIYVNDAFVRLTGYSREEAIGQTPRFLQGPATSRAGLDLIKQALRNRQAIQIEIINYTKAGTEYWIGMDIAPMFDSQGMCTAFVAVERDITERKKMEAQSAYNLERFQHIVDATNDIIWDAELATGHVTYNENLKKILGHDPAIRQLTIKDWEAWVHPEDRSRVTGTIANALVRSAPPVDMEYRIRKADGSYAVLTDHSKVIRDAEGLPRRIVGSMSDVTERRVFAEHLRQTQQLEAVGQLTGGVAHDFNNLLTVILGNSELLVEKLAAQPKLQKLAEMTVTMALRGAELTSRLLAFARRQPLEPKLIAVNALLTAMEDWMRRTLPASIRIQINGAPDLWQIEADPHQLENAVLNLAVNARDAMPHGGALTISTTNCTLDADVARHLPEAKPGDYVRISVQDGGTGMDPATLARAFEPFFTTKAKGKGSGLGLSMVYGFLRQSSGFATIDSVLGQGTTVHLHFPRASEAPREGRPHTGTGAVIGGSQHILVVEDEESVLESVMAKLEALGYRATAALTGSAALKILAQDATVELLFTDIVMPGDLSGPDLVRQAKTLRPGLKVLYTSGYTDDTIMHDGKVDAGLNLLTKPYRLADLAAKIRAVLDG